MHQSPTRHQCAEKRRAAQRRYYARKRLEKLAVQVKLVLLLISELLGSLLSIFGIASGCRRWQVKLVPSLISKSLVQGCWHSLTHAPVRPTAAPRVHAS